MLNSSGYVDIGVGETTDTLSDKSGAKKSRLGIVGEL
jgi:hypothetical protein